MDLSSILKCDIISYDYTGTGLSSGKFNEESIQSDLENIIDFICDITDTHIDSILLMGQSFGAMPTINVISETKYEGVAGIVLISPLENYLATKYNRATRISISSIQTVKCPVFLIQGKCDAKEQVEKSEELAMYITNLYKWFPKNETTGSILSGSRFKFYKKFMNFIDFVKQKSIQKVNSNLNIGNDDNYYNGISENKDNAIIMDRDHYMSSYKKESYSGVKIAFESIREGGGLYSKNTENILKEDPNENID